MPKDKQHTAYTSRYAIGETVGFDPIENNPATDPLEAVVVGIHFTASKVTYDLDLALGGETLRNVDSCFVQDGEQMSGAPFEIKIDQAAVERQVVDAILASSLGVHIETAINKLLNETERWGNATVLQNAIQAEVLVQVRQATQNALLAQKDKITALVAERMTDEKLGELVTKIWDHALRDR